MKAGGDVEVAASELHLCQLSDTNNPKKEKVQLGQTSAPITFLMTGRKLNFLSIDYTGPCIPKVNS